MAPILGICIVSLAALNVYASLRCYKNALSSRAQRAAQIVFIWLVPLLGAALAQRLSRNEPERSLGTYPKEKDPEGGCVTGLGELNSQGYLSSPDDTFHKDRGDSVPPD